MADDVAEMGPVDYLVVEFPGSQMTGEGFPLLVDLVDRGLIKILDLVFVKKEEDGAVMAMEIADFDGDGQLDLAVFEGASSGLIGEDDLAEAGGVLEAGQLGRHPRLRERVGGAICHRPAARRWPARREWPDPCASSSGGSGRRRLGFQGCLIGERVSGPLANNERKDTCQDFSVEWHGQLWSRVRRQRFPTGCRDARPGRWAQQDQPQQQYQEPPPQYQQPPPPPAASGGSGDMIEQLKQLAELKDQGVLTEAEFAVQKSRILGA